MFLRQRQDRCIQSDLGFRRAEMHGAAEAKVRLLEKRLGKARGDAKTKIDARIKATRAEYQRRSELLRQAWEMARQAVAG